MSSVKERWASLPRPVRVLLALSPIVLYAVLLHVPGIGTFLHDKAPYDRILNGAIEGIVYALGAFGIILIYRANRFINFAHGALGSLVGVLCIGMVLEHHVSYWIMLPACVVGGMVVGALTEFLLIRRFQTSSRLIVTVVSIGLAQLYGLIELFGSAKINFVSLVGPFKPPLDFSLNLGRTEFAGDHLMVIIAAPLVIIGLAWFLLRTDAGIAVRASAENVDRALLLGIPVRRLATIVWAIAGGLAALSFMLTASFEGVKPGVAGNGPTVLLPLLATAVLAGMESLPKALIAGIGLGAMEAIARWNSTGAPSIIYLVYLVVIIAALLAQRGKLSRAVESGGSSWTATGVVKPIPPELRGFPEVKYAKAGLIGVMALLFIFLPKGWSISSQGLATFAIIAAMVGVSLVVLTGWGGHISLGQYGIVGVGALVGMNMIDRWNADVFFVVLGAGAAGGLVALIVGLPALRIRGLFLAVTTLAFAIALDGYFLNKKQFDSLIPAGFPKRPLLWERFELNDNYHMYLFALAFLGLSILAALGVRKARSGRVLVAARDNQRAADAASVPTTQIKLSGFLLSGVIAGVAGALFVLQLRSLGEGTGVFEPTASINIFATSVIGGLGSITGAITGVLMFKWFETFKWHGDARPLISGAGLIPILYFLPGGFGQLIFGARDRYLRWVANRHDIVVPSLVADKRSDGEKRAANEVGLLQGALAGPSVPAGMPPPTPPSNDAASKSEHELEPIR
ncbi:MAG: branched-chain amino acid transport system permease protein livM [Acidimicrobiaceae bacterium]